MAGNIPECATAERMPSTDCVAGVDLGATNLRIGLADMSGEVIARWVGSTAGIQDARLIVCLIRDGVVHLLAQVSRPRSSLRAVGVGAPGVTNVQTGVVIATSYLMGWCDVPLRAMLEAELGVPAIIDNDVNLAALGESWLGAGRSFRDFIFVAIGTGVGAGIVLEGKLYRGTRWTAGEIGYMLVPGVATGPVKPDEPGQLESMIGGEGIKAQWQRVCDEEKISLPRDLSATEIFDLAVAGSASAQIVLTQTARLLAYAIYNMSLLVDCPLFVFGGTVGQHAALLASTRDFLDKMGGPQPRIEPSALGAGAQLMGAIRSALTLASQRSSSVPASTG